MRKLSLFILVVLLVSFVSAQSLLDNPDYKKSLELKELSEKAYEEGDYDAAYEYAKESKEYALKSDAYVEEMREAYKAASSIKAAEERIAYLDSKDAETQFPEEMQNARVKLEAAKVDYDAKNYESSKANSDEVLASLAGLEMMQVEDPVEVVVPVIEDKKTLPKYYTVRLKPGDRDTLTKIAAYDFVYGDKELWTELYKANKDKLKDSKNPHLIFPGQVFEIPSLKGEIREGLYKE